MNIIRMPHEECLKYFSYERFTKSALSRYADWLDRYTNVGNVAFPYFVVITTPGDNVKLIMSVEQDNTNRRHHIIAYLKLINGRELYYPFVFEASKKGNHLSILVDIPEDDEAWRSIGIRSFGEIPHELGQDIALGCVCLFAKIQSEALKCQRKIIRLQKQQDESEKQTNETDEREANNNGARNVDRVIHLCPGITYSCSPSSKVPRKFTRHCEAWFVRGHYRHYKSGKIAYVRPHQKGAGKLKKNAIYEFEEEHYGRAGTALPKHTLGT